MKKIELHALEKARQKLMNAFPLERLKQIPKYRDCTKTQYLQLIQKLEILGLLLLESYIIHQSNQL